MLRKDGNYEFYRVEEFQGKWNRWIPITDEQYLEEYRHGQNTACGDCWQETGEHGIYDFEYAKRFCNDLNQTLKEDKISAKRIKEAEITQFRLVKCVVVQQQIPLEYCAY